MTRRRYLTIAAFAVTLPAVFPFASSSAAPVPSASASAVPVEALPVLVGKDIPEAASRAPTDAEWAGARVVRPHRGAPGPCTYRNMREWLEIRCKDLAGAGLVAGDPKGVAVRVIPGKEEAFLQPAVRAVVPIRRGEAKVLGFLELRFEYSGTSFGEAGTLSIQWRAGRPDPVLVASGFVPEERPPER